MEFTGKVTLVQLIDRNLSEISVVHTVLYDVKWY